MTQYTVDSMQRLIDINGDQTQFKAEFTLSSEDPFDMAIVSQKQLDTDDIPFHKVSTGSTSGSYEQSNSEYQSYYLVLKADDPTTVNVDLRLSEKTNIPDIMMMVGVGAGVLAIILLIWWLWKKKKKIHEPTTADRYVYNLSPPQTPPESLTPELRSLLSDDDRSSIVISSSAPSLPPSMKASPARLPSIKAPSPVASVKAESIVPSPVPSVRAESIVPSPVASVRAESIVPSPVASVRAESIVPSPVASVRAESITPSPVPSIKAESITPSPVASVRADSPPRRQNLLAKLKRIAEERKRG